MFIHAHFDYHAATDGIIILPRISYHFTFQFGLPQLGIMHSSRTPLTFNVFTTDITAFAGINYFGLLGLIIGPLAISYFFELIRMYKEEYLAA
jgi:hypothetical protein